MCRYNAWGIIRYPLWVYLGLRFYYFGFAAIITFIYHPPYEGVVKYSDPFSKYLLINWQHWDTIWYLRIASQGYLVSDGRSVFPPLYPLLVKLLAMLLDNYLLAAMVVSGIAGVIATILLYLVAKETMQEEVAKISILVLLSFPTATFFYGAYTEPLFLAMALGVFVTARRGRFGLASILVALATLTRYQGVILALPLGWIIWTSDTNRKEWKAFAYSIVPVLSLLIFWWARSQWIDPTPLGRIYAQYWHSRFGFPGENVLAGLASLPKSLNVRYFINWLDIGLLALIFITTPFVIRLLPFEYGIYQISTLGVLLLRTGPADHPLQGMARYMLLMFPSFIVIAGWMEKGKRKVLLIPNLILSTWVLGMFILGIGLLG